MSSQVQVDPARSPPAQGCARCLKVLSQAYDADLVEEDGGGTIGSKRLATYHSIADIDVDLLMYLAQALRLHRDADELVNGVLRQCWCCIRVCRSLQHWAA